MHITYTTLDINTLLFTYGDCFESADLALKEFAKENTITLGDVYEFDFIVSQGGKKQTTKFVYYVVDDEVRGRGSIQSVTFKHHNFIKIVCNQDELSQVLEGQKKDELEQFLKKDHHRLDISKIFALYQTSETDTTIYMQYK